MLEPSARSLTQASPARDLRRVALRSFPGGRIAAPGRVRAQGLSAEAAEKAPCDALPFHGALTASTASALCQSVRARLETGARVLSLDLQDVKAVDAIGLAALAQSARLGALLGVQVSIAPSAAIHRGMLDAGLLDEFSLEPTGSAAGPLWIPSPEYRVRPLIPFLARTPRLGLRQPAWEELILFERWANEPSLDELVGSEFLYRCRHLSPYHPEFVSLVLNDATSLTLLVQPLDVSSPPVGFVRLYNIRLIEGFTFLETVVADLRSLRRGWGIEASRLLLAYAMDALWVRRVEAKVYAYNLLSINSLKRNGFQQEGTLREARIWDGQRWDILVFSILEGEMIEQRKQDQFPYMGFWGDRDDLP